MTAVIIADTISTEKPEIIYFSFSRTAYINRPKIACKNSYTLTQIDVTGGWPFRWIIKCNTINTALPFLATYMYKWAPITVCYKLLNDKSNANCTCRISSKTAEWYKSFRHGTQIPWVPNGRMKGNKFSDKIGITFLLKILLITYLLQKW